jgi:glycosyltransferase involved in cell wall biosynthesis
MHTGNQKKLLNNSIKSVLGLVSYKVFPAQMGGQKCVVDFYRHLAKYTQVTLAVAKENGPIATESFPVLPFLFNHWWGFLNLVYVFKLKKLIKTEKIDLIVIEHSYFGWLGLVLKRITGVPVVIRSHNIEAHRFRDLQRSWWPIYDWYEKKVHQRVDNSFFITSEDKNLAINHWQLAEKTCSVLTYGTDITTPVGEQEKKHYRGNILQKFGLAANARIFFFNGSLDYLPNTDALRIVVNELIPLLTSFDFSFSIIITGSGLNEQWKQELKKYPQLIYLGFVEDIEQYYLGADCFINPVTLGCGIKTKLVEALACNLTSISTRTGARGIDLSVIDGKLLIIDDYDWDQFAAAMVNLDTSKFSATPALFYQTFNWDTIIQNALLSLQAYV